MLGPHQKVLLSPLEKPIERYCGIEADVKLITVHPNLQPHHHDADVQSLIQLEIE